DARGFAEDGDFAWALDRALLIEDRVQIVEFRLRGRRSEMPQERLLARLPAVPGIVPGGAGQRRGVAGRGASQHFRAIGSVDRAALGGDRFENGLELFARTDRLDPCGLLRGFARRESRTEHVVFAALVARIEK